MPLYVVIPTQHYVTRLHCLAPLRQVLILSNHPRHHFFSFFLDCVSNKHPKVQSWLTKRSRFHFHFIPTSSSWLNLVERWFGEITRKRIRRGVFQSVEQLVQAIDDYIAQNNKNPNPQDGLQLVLLIQLSGIQILFALQSGLNRYL